MNVYTNTSEIVTSITSRLTPETKQKGNNNNNNNNNLFY